MKITTIFFIVSTDTMGNPIQLLSLSGVNRACDRAIVPGVMGDKAYNLTINGKHNHHSIYTGSILSLRGAQSPLLLVFKI